MSWLTFAAGLLRDVMTSDNSPSTPQVEAAPPQDLADLVNLVNRHRLDAKRGFEAVSQVIQEQNERLERALRIQRRWNYGLLAALLAMTAVAAALYWWK